MLMMPLYIILVELSEYLGYDRCCVFENIQGIPIKYRF